MMTRALADKLEFKATGLPSSSLVRLCSYLGSLEMPRAELPGSLLRPTEAVAGPLTGPVEHRDFRPYVGKTIDLAALMATQFPH